MNLSATEESDFFSPFKDMQAYDHEQLVFCQEKKLGLKAIICIHDTTLGPSCGGTRMWNYASEKEALQDALRLARGMTYKSAIAGIDAGGGKAVIIGNPAEIKSEALFRRFGQFINSLGGRYVTACDVNMTTQDLEMIYKSTPYVVGLPETLGGSGASSIITAYGTYMGIKAGVKEVFGTDSLEGKKVAIQGAGGVGYKLAEYLSKEGVTVFISDYDQRKLMATSKASGAHFVDVDEIYDVDADVYAPCALGATINDLTIPRLKCKIIAGAANNQLADENKHAKALEEKGILYAPDFLVNGGGVTAVVSEYYKQFNKEHLFHKVGDIYNKCIEVFRTSKQHKITTHEAAMQMAVKRIEAVNRIKGKTF